MCGRYALTEDWVTVLAAFGVQEAECEYTGSDNIAPGQLVATIVGTAAGRRRAGLIRWGLPRRWREAESSRPALINARSETVFEKSAFRGLVARRRCLIPVNSYYEWQASESGKQPFRIELEHRKLFALAGLYDVWTNATGVRTAGCVILTKEADASIAMVHDRMPVILRCEEESLWLDRTAAREDVASLLRGETAESLHVAPMNGLGK